MLSAEHLARIDRLAGLIGTHTAQTLALVHAWQRGTLTAQERDEALRRRFNRTVVALLAVTHEDGPP